MTQTYQIQVSMNQSHLVDSGFTWKQGDFGFNIEIEILDFDTTGVTAQIIFRKPSGAVESTSLTQSGNKFTYTLRGTELDTPGPCICDLKLKNSTTQRISTASFKYFTIPDTMDGLNQQANSYSDTIEQTFDIWEGQVDSLKNSDDIIASVLSINMFPSSNYVDGKYLTYNTGNEANNASYFYTQDFIPVIPEQKYYFANVSQGQICYYDSAKTYKSGIIFYNGDSYITIPSGVEYMRCSFAIANRSSYGLYTLEDYANAGQGKSYYIELIKNAAGNLMGVTPISILPGNYSSLLPDLNNALNNHSYVLTFSGFSTSNIPENMPYGIYVEACTLITLGTSNNYKLQYLFGTTGIFARLCAAGTWVDWKCIKKPKIEVNAPVHLIALVESGFPCTINLNTDVELYGAYKSAKGATFWQTYSGYASSNNLNLAGLYIHPHVSLNGNGHTISFDPNFEELLPDYSAAITAMRTQFSPLNFGGDNIIQNLILDVGTNTCRYAIHDDFVSTPEGVIMKDLKLNGTPYQQVLIGAGVKAYSSYLIENCIFLNNLGAYDISYHAANPSVEAPSYLTIKDCYLTNSIRINNHGTNTQVTECIITNNKLAGIDVGYTTGSSIENMIVRSWNNEIAA